MGRRSEELDDYLKTHTILEMLEHTNAEAFARVLTMRLLLPLSYTGGG